MIYLHLLIGIILNTLALMVTTYIVPGFHVTDWQAALLAAIVLGVVNTFVKPIFAFLTAPINVLTLGLFTFVLNAVMLMLVSSVVSGFTLDGWLAAILGAIVLSLVSTGLSTVLKDIAPAVSGKKK